MNSTAKFQLLVIDDDQLILDSLKLILPTNWQMTTTISFSQMLQQKQRPLFFHAAFVDQHLSGNLKISEGLGEIKTLHDFNPQIEIVAISGDMSLELMEKCLANGAAKFLAKPLSRDEVIANLEKIEALWQLREAQAKGSKKQQQWIGQSSAAETIKKNIAALRGEDGPILIEGETGTGKEVVFRLLNQQEATRPAIMVNIASIPENLFESELFGHVKGAFTGAEQMKVGLCEAANGGDLFLDEIEAMPLSQQVKLLRFLETGEVRKVGSKEILHTKCRVIVASNQNLQQLAKDGKFREDLFFRISGKKLLLPALRERKEDIPELTKFFLAQQRPRSNKMLAPEALSALQAYSWPGNVRELKRVCEQLALTSPLPIVRTEDVHNLLQGSRAQDLSAIDPSIGLTKMVENFEAKVIHSFLQKESDIEKIAAQLQISRSSLYKKIKDYQIGQEQGGS